MIVNDVMQQAQPEPTLEKITKVMEDDSLCRLFDWTNIGYHWNGSQML